MKVLLLATHLNTGGITSYLFILGKGLVSSGHEVYVVSSGGEMRDAFNKDGIKTFDFNIKTKSEIDLKIYMALGPLADVIRKEKVDIIHAQTRVTQVMAFWLSRMTGKPFVSTCHGYFKTRFFRRIFPCWGERVIAISQAVHDHLHDDFKCPREKIVLVESGINLDEFPVLKDEERAAAKKELGLTQNLTVGMIARLSQVKGQDFLIKAMPQILERHPSVKLLLVGEGKTKEVLESIVSELRIKNNVMFLPIVNKTRTMLAAMDIFVMPSRQEGLGLSLIEAQACGVAVIGSNVGGIVSLIENSRTGLLFESENPQSLSESILTLLEDPSLGKRMALNARQQVEARFSHRFMIDKTIKVYKELNK